MNLTHHFLVSMPQLQDSTFKDSVIYILDHNKDGAYGVIVNHEMDMSLGEVFKQLSIDSSDADVGSVALLNGGPVDEGNGLVLHRPGQKFDITRDFDGGISVSSSKDVLESIARCDPPDEYLVLLGHAGWAAGQLEMEVADNAWLTVAASASIIFDTPLAERRHAVCKEIGIDLNKLVGHSGNA